MIQCIKITLYLFITFFSQFIHSQEVVKNDLKSSEFNFDITKYLGTWYEQVRLPTSFQKKCDSSSAQYTLNNDGTIKVLNICNRIDGSSNEIIGKAKIDSKDPSGRNLIVSFNFITDIINFFKGVNYSIYYIDNSYKYAIVGTPQKDMLWILTREKTIPSEALEKLINSAKEFGFDISKIIYDKR
ncbi:lipocalin family protein [Fluviispira vulneris]|uniref:lipocalin family protein n=1 Tax=Fluviispira vulneris TaxID=2763012 RepID=UPI001645DDFC|nr:lipocalin family protein [Fluviispira vulneris]